MIEVMFLFLIGLLWIIFASVQDLRKREVANWISFSLIVFALGFRFFYSLFNESWGFFLQGIIGLAIFFLIGNLLYYSRMFAGGDAKLMIALGPVLAFTNHFFTNLEIYFLFLFLFLFGGAVYGLSATIYLSFKHRRDFKRDFAKKIKENKRLIFSVIFFGIIFTFLGFLQPSFAIFGVLMIAFPILYVYAKAVDNSCMIKDMHTNDLTEGEWLYKPIKVGKKTIKPNWEGLSLEEVNLIKKKYKIIKIKVGIAFVPVFLIAFLILGYLWKTGLWSALI